MSQAKTPQERFAALEKLSDTTRARIDAEARAALVTANPKWLDEALNSAKTEKGEVAIRLKGGRATFAGVENPEELVAILDAAPLATDPSPSAAAKQAQQQLDRYTANYDTFYRIRVLERAPEWEVVSYGEAATDGTLDKLLTAALEPRYKQLRERSPDTYRKPDGTWKSLAEVQDTVADIYFKDLLAALEQNYKQSVTKKENQAELSRNGAAAQRLFAYVSDVQAKLQKNPALAAEWLAQPTAAEKTGTITAAKSLKEQFKLVQAPFALARSADRPQEDKTAIFALKPQEWTAAQTRPNGDIWFFQLTQKQAGDSAGATAQQLAAARSLLASDAQHLLMHQVLEEIKARNAISFVERNQEENTTSGSP